MNTSSADKHFVNITQTVIVMTAPKSILNCSKLHHLKIFLH